MKRLKCILLIGILSCAIGCQNQNITAVSEEVPSVSPVVEVVSASETESPESLFEKFLNGEIDAKPLPGSDRTKSVNVADLNMNPEEWSFDSFSEGERLDLDNDGENELILNGPYGGMYLDEIDGDLYVFAEATGNAGALSYTYYENAYWVVHSDTTHAGRLGYILDKYEGGDNLVESMKLLGEKYNEGEEGTYSFNGQAVSEEEFFTLRDEIFNSVSSR